MKPPQKPNWFKEALARNSPARTEQEKPFSVYRDSEKGPLEGMAAQQTIRNTVKTTPPSGHTDPKILAPKTVTAASSSEGKLTRSVAPHQVKQDSLERCAEEVIDTETITAVSSSDGKPKRPVTPIQVKQDSLKRRAEEVIDTETPFPVTKKARSAAPAVVLSLEQYWSRRRKSHPVSRQVQHGFAADKPSAAHPSHDHTQSTRDSHDRVQLKSA